MRNRTILSIASFLLFFQMQAQINPATNHIALDISTFPQNSSFNYDSCFAVADNLGAASVGMSQNWTAIETAPHVFNMSLFDIANYYYPAHNMPVDLTVTPIHTNNLEVPSDLTTTAFDDPAFISRFNILLDSIKMHTPNLVLSSLVIGSEHDVYLGSNTTKWAQYTTFYNSVLSHAHTLWPGVKVATELTFGGITIFNALAQTMNTNSDYIGVSYYPLNPDFTVQSPTVVATDFNTICSLYPTKPICYYQFGYPSSPTCNSSESLQSQFITETFTAWDAHPANIRMIDFTWLHDLDTALVNYYGTYYGITNAAFLEFLHTLGLRQWSGSGTDKPALLELECQAKQRGYNNMSIVCSTGIPEEKSKVLYISPNPARGHFGIANSMLLIKARLKIFDVKGQKVKDIPVTALTAGEIDIQKLPDGMYFVILENNNKLFTTKLIIQNEN